MWKSFDYHSTLLEHASSKIYNQPVVFAGQHFRIELKQTCMEMIRFILGYFFDCV